MIIVRVLRLSPIYTYGLCHFLRSWPEFEVADETEAGYEEIRGDGRVDIIGDVGLGAESSIISKMAANAPVLVLADSTTPPVVNHYFFAGALGCVHSASPPKTIIEALRVVAEGRRFLAAAPIQESVAGHASQVLSRRESEVLMYIAQGRTHDQIARLLGISRHTVDTYVKRARRKLQLGNKAELTRVAMLGGPIMPGPGNIGCRGLNSSASGGVRRHF